MNNRSWILVEDTWVNLATADTIYIASYDVTGMKKGDCAVRHGGNAKVVYGDTVTGKSNAKLIGLFLSERKVIE